MLARAQAAAMTRCDNGVWATTQMFGMTATEFVVLNNADRDALHEPWRVRSVRRAVRIRAARERRGACDLVRLAQAALHASRAFGSFAAALMPSSGAM